MASMTIKDLSVSKGLDSKTMAAVSGGNPVGPPININTKSGEGGGIAVLTFGDGSRYSEDILGNLTPLPK